MKTYHDHDPSTLLEAKVAKVCETYVVAFPTKPVGDLTQGDSITFRLRDWQGTEEPQHSQVVMLANTMLYINGWRAREAYPITPVCTQTARRKA